MDCSQAQIAIAAGLRPGSSNEARAMLGFHVMDCPICRALLAQAQAGDQHLLQELLAAPISIPQTAEAVVAASKPPRRTALRAMLALCLIAVLGALGWWWLSAPPAAGFADSSPVPGAPAGGIIPSAEAAATATATPAPTPSPTPEPTATPPPSPTPEPLPEQFTVLLLGLDRRPGEQELSRSDAMMVLHFDAANNRIALLSLPRDLWVPLPDDSRYVKINAAYQAGESAGGPAGGAATARETVATLLNQTIDGTVVTTFEGLMQTVDTVGGIDVEVPKYIYDGQYPTFDYGYMVAEFVPGLQHMDGFTALVYSRTRHADNDFERGKRQQQVIMALSAAIQQYVAAGNDPVALVGTLFGQAEYSDLDLALTARMLQGLQDQPDFQRDSVDLRYGYETSTVDGAYIIQPDVPAIQALAASLFGTEQ